MKTPKNLTWRITDPKSGKVSYVMGVVHPLAEDDLDKLFTETSLLEHSLLQCDFLVTPYSRFSHKVREDFDCLPQPLKVPLPAEHDDIWCRLHEFAESHFIAHRHLEQGHEYALYDRIRLAAHRLYDDPNRWRNRLFAASAPVIWPYFLGKRARDYLNGLVFNMHDIQDGYPVRAVLEDLADPVKLRYWYQSCNERWMDGRNSNPHQVLRHGLSHAMKHRSIFLAVDMTHLVMQGGLLQMLQKKGFLIEPESTPKKHMLPKELVHIESLQ